MLNIAIAVATAALMLTTAYLGVHVTLHPADSEGSKRNYKIGFSACATAACVLIGIQAYRTNKAQSAVDVKLGKIEKNTEEPPKVQVTNVVPQARVEPRKMEPRFSVRMEGNINNATHLVDYVGLILTSVNISQGKGIISCGDAFAIAGVVSFFGGSGSTMIKAAIDSLHVRSGRGPWKEAAFTLRGQAPWTPTNPLSFTLSADDHFSPDSCAVTVREYE
jgi:hypothetical protein